MKIDLIKVGNNVEYKKRMAKKQAPNEVQKAPRYKQHVKRGRKQEEQYDILRMEFQVNQNWNKTMIAELSAKSGLDHIQVYKWNWDQRKRTIQ